MAIYTAAEPTYKMAIYTISILMQKWLYMRLPGLLIQMTKNTAAVFNAKTAVYTATGHIDKNG